MYQFQTASPEETGIPSETVIRLLDDLKRQEIPMHSFLLCHRDRLVAEGYYAPCQRGELHRLFSVTKSFVSIAIGVLCDRGRLSLDDPIIQYFPEYLPDPVHPWLARTTIRHMLMMRSCHASTTYKVNPEKNWVESFFTVPPSHKPGTVFHYDTSASHTLCALAEKLTGKKLLDFLREVCLDELGFSKEAYILEDPFGTSLGGSGLMATSRDFLLFALLILRQGALNGKQYLPAWYLKEAAACHTATCVTGPIPEECRGYGYQLWRGAHGTVICYGMGGQLAILFPDYDCICITTADTQCMGGGNQVIYDAVYRHLLPVLRRNRPAGCGPSELICESLNLPSYLAGLRIDPLPGRLGSYTGSRSSSLSGIRYRIPDSRTDQLQAVSFDLGQDSGSFRFFWKGLEHRLPFGFGFLAESRFPVYDMKCGASAVWLSDNCLYIKIHLLDTSVGSIHIQAYFGEDDVTLFLRKQEESLFKEFSGHLYGIACRPNDSQ